MDEVEDLVNTEDKTSFENMTGSVCGKRFPKSKGKIYCSKECRDADKHYPSLEEVNEQYEILKNWEKVAQHFGLSYSRNKKERLIIRRPSRELKIGIYELSVFRIVFK